MTDHPDYFVGRPGACEGCYIGWVHFVPHLGKEQLAHITDFQLDCFTKWKPCELTEDILPMAAPYHLYDQEARNAGWSRESPVCSLSPYTRGRDAYWVVVLDALSTESHKLGEYEEHEGYEYGEHVKVSWVSVLKGDLPPHSKGGPERSLPCDRFTGKRSDDFNASTAPRHLLPDHRYIRILFDTDGFDNDKDVGQDKLVGRLWTRSLTRLTTGLSLIAWNSGGLKVCNLRRWITSKPEIVFTHR